MLMYKLLYFFGCKDTAIFSNESEKLVTCL